MRARSLRQRLIVATVALVALGLLATSVGTYFLMRGWLVSRVDEQLVEAEKNAMPLEGRGGYRPPHGSRSRSPGEGPSLPFTVIERLDAGGEIVDYVSFGIEEVDSPLDLPGALPGQERSDGATGDGRIFFDTTSQDGLVRYRAMASAQPSGGTLVVAQPLSDVEGTLGRLLALEATVSALVLGATGALSLWVVRLGLQPLSRIERTAAEIAEGDLSRRVEPADERTELGRLGNALNVMMERIEAAFEERRASESKLRRFIADASHELRTPLTSIRGYAELFRNGAQRHPDDLEKSMRRIEEESARMGSLVEEMLLLARLDQDPDLEQEEVDLCAIVVDAVDDAHAVQPDQAIKVDAPEKAVVLGDQARLRQVVANLLSNALKHSPAGSEVRVQVTTEGGQAMLSVQDEGLGLGPEHAKRVFDRFYRVDKARARGEGGAGLGLSIVQAIVHAHHGRVWVETAPGRGAVFRVALPMGVRPSTD